MRTFHEARDSVDSSGYIAISQMMRYGVILDILGFFVIIAIVLGLGPLVF